MPFFVWVLYLFRGVNMLRKIVVTSGKGGVGKTTIVAFLGRILAEKGYRVLLVDMDFGLNNLDVLMGVENKIVYDLIDVIEGRCLPQQALIEDFYNSNLYVLPSTHGFCSKKFGGEDLCNIIKCVERDFQFVLIDCPAGIDGGFSRAIACGSEYILVTTPHLSAIRDCGKVINKLKESIDVSPYLIVNRARGDLMLDGEMITVKEVTQSLSVQLIGVISEDDEISKQLLFGGKLSDYSDSKLSIDMIGDNLIHGDNKIFDCERKYKGLFGAIRKNIKKRI